MKNIYIILFCLFSSLGFSQEDAWVYFNSKPNSQFYFDNPLEMLSQRSLDRRAAQNIALDFQDIPIDQSFVETVDASAGITVMARSKWLNAVHVRGTIANINSLSALPFVSEIDFADNSLNTGRISQNSSAGHSNKILENQVIFPYGNSDNQIMMLNGHLLHQQDYTGAGKIIAVLDAGFPAVDVVQPFARLRDNNLILGGYNFVAGNDNFYTGNTHGTLVLSTMGGYTENELVGTAPDAAYYLFITEDIANENPVEESYWVEAAETADSLGVDVINTSLGYFTYDNPAYSYTYEELNGQTAFASRGADIAFSRGMVVVVSAGNSGGSDNPHVAVPGDAVNVLTVGAVDATGSYTTFSSIGPTADGRVKPDVMAQGQSAVLSNTSGNIVTASGTSFSGPIIAGMVATFWQAVPNLTNAEVVQVIKESSSLYTTPTSEMGYGIPDFQQALALAQLSIVSQTADSFILYPNPVQDQLYIALPSGEASASFTLYNGLGQVISAGEFANGQQINLENVSSGVYYYRLASANKTRSGRLIKA
ncbi:MAG TPA: S8 family serine peptidase [Flavobacterium sp.]